MAPHPLNRSIASRLDEVARLLEEQGANAFRVAAYRNGADTLRRLDRPIGEIFAAAGLEGLEALPSIGPRLARAIRDLLLTGRLPMLERLRGESDPVALLGTVPGIGTVLAERLWHELGIESLEGLEAAAYDGRLRDVAGIGDKRLAGIRDSLATRLGRVRKGPPPVGTGEPPVAELLDVDREYRRGARTGTLRRIAPRRFNPRHQAWLPILHTRRGEHEYTALFSNTARAHQLDRTHDWVVVYCDGSAGNGSAAERQYTVVTAHGGPLAGRRVVRGREPECARAYAAANDARPMALVEHVSSGR